MIEYIGIGIGILTFIGGVFGVFMALNIKVKELEGKINEIDSKLNDLKNKTIEDKEDLKEMISMLFNKLDEIDKKIEVRNEALIKLKTEHEQMMNNYCKYKNNNR